MILNELNLIEIYWYLLEVFVVFVVIALHTCIYMKVKVKVTQLCLTLCDPMDYTVYK